VLVHQPLSIAVLVFPLSVLAMAVRSVNYALFMFFLTPQFVLIAELFQTGGGGDPELAKLRALDSAIGGLLGLLAGFFLWPSWEGPRLPKQLAAAVRANRDYFMRAVSVALGDAAADIGAVQRQAGLASNNAEASLQRLMGEPRRQVEGTIEPAMMILACLRRLAGVAAMLTLLPEQTQNLGARTALAAIREWSGSALSALADALERGAPPPPLPSFEAELVALESSRFESGPAAPQVLLDGLRRAQRQIEVLAAATDRLSQVLV
jgi:uncharacterized membrane protein YccC